MTGNPRALVRGLLGGLVTAVVVSPLEAQEAQEAELPPFELAVEAAVARALVLSEEVRVARAEREVTESQIVQARSGALPQVSAAVAYDRTLASVFDGLDAALPNGDGDGFGALPFGRPNTWSGALQISQPVYTGGRLTAGIDMARSARAAADFQVADAEADIALEVRTAYFRSVLAGETVEIAREAYEVADAQLRQVELFLQQGTASEFEVLTARVERDNLQPGIIEAESAERVAVLNLKRLTNIPADQPVQLVTPLDPTITDVDRAELRWAVNQSPALSALGEIISVREGAVQLARAQRLPNVGVAGTFSYQAFPDRVTPFGADWRRDWSVGVQASIPVFNGFRTQGEIDQAMAELELAELQRERMRQALELELNGALGDFDAARAQIEARRATVGQAQRALELAELRFATGLATQLELSNARLSLQQARMNEAQSLFDYVDALARLERVAGGTIPLVAPRLPASSGEEDR